MNVAAAFELVELSQVAAPRRAVTAAAERLGFDQTRTGKAALVATELATNLVKHATRGEMLVRPVGPIEDGDVPYLEVLAIDAGPGMADIARARQDGHSTAGSLGHGLGAIERQSDFFQIYTHASGTVMLARLWKDAAPRRLRSRYEIGAVQVSHPNEEVCGDEWSARVHGDRLAIIVADGLGHGLAAHDAALAACDVFVRLHEESPARVIEHVHGALRATRGAAVAVLEVDGNRGVARYCGVGNVAGVVLHAAGTRHSMVSQNGTAGHTVGRIHEFSYPMPSDSIIILASDGLGTHWDLAAYPGLRNRDASIIAGVLYRDFSRRRDDVTVVVAKGGSRSRSEKL